jgi:glycosyltransferase involved in cell wall biosynthesis
MDDVYISVIITAYNRREFLLNAIKSALNQTLSKDRYEIIVIKNFNDDKIDDCINKNNIKNILIDGTLGEFLYKAINESHGNILSFLDDNDLFLNNKLEYVYNLFKNDNNLVYYHNLPKFIDESGNTIKKKK